jgi:hypothetical protein
MQVNSGRLESVNSIMNQSTNKPAVPKLKLMAVYLALSKDFIRVHTVIIKQG